MHFGGAGNATAVRLQALNIQDQLIVTDHFHLDTAECQKCLEISLIDTIITTDFNPTYTHTSTGTHTHTNANTNIHFASETGISLIWSRLGRKARSYVATGSGEIDLCCFANARLRCRCSLFARRSASLFGTFRTFWIFSRIFAKDCLLCVRCVSREAIASGSVKINYFHSVTFPFGRSIRISLPLFWAKVFWRVSVGG